MRLDDLYLWHLATPATPRYVGTLRLVSSGKGVSLHYDSEWLANGFALSEDLPLSDNEFLPPGRLAAEVVAVIDIVNTWQEHFAHVGVLERDIVSLAE